LKSVVEVESKENEYNDIKDGIGLVREQVKRHAVKVMVIRNPCHSFRGAGDALFDQVKVHQVDGQENAYDYPRMDHEF